VLAFGGAALLAPLPAAADTSPAPVTPTVTVVVPGAPAAVAPPAPPPAGYPPGAYGAVPPAPYYGPPGAYPPPPGYYGPPPGAYYPPSFQRPLFERQSTGAMAGGIVLISAGGVLLLAGAIAAIPSCQDTFNQNEDFTTTCDNHTATVVGLVVSGVVAIAAGIPLTIWGARKVPVGTAAAGALPSSPLPAWAGAPTRKGWGWQF
jgi:hypothetical protein